MKPVELSEKNSRKYMKGIIYYLKQNKNIRDLYGGEREF
jgi:hypothetical protein